MSYYQNCSNCGQELDYPNLEESFSKVRECSFCRVTVPVDHSETAFLEYLTELFEKVEKLTKVVKHQQKQIKELSSDKT